MFSQHSLVKDLLQLGHYFETKVTQLLVADQRRKREKNRRGWKKKERKMISEQMPMVYLLRLTLEVVLIFTMPTHLHEISRLC